MHLACCNWDKPSVPFILSPNHVHVGCVQLTFSAEQILQFTRYLSTPEKIRSERFRQQRDRDRFIIGRAILRIVLSHILNYPIDRLEFNYNTHGKPQLIPFPHVQFNLSHSEDLILYALTQHYSLGIDIEYQRPTADIMGIAQRFFSANEYNALKQLSNTEQNTAFFKLWTRKEAFIKALGVGLSYPLNQVEVSLNDEISMPLLTSKDHLAQKTAWFLYPLNPKIGYSAALVTQERLLTIHSWCWNEVINWL